MTSPHDASEEVPWDRYDERAAQATLLRYAAEFWESAIDVRDLALGEINRHAREQTAFRLMRAAKRPLSFAEFDTILAFELGFLHDEAAKVVNATRERAKALRGQLALLDVGPSTLPTA